jgi:hypothetical protein
MPDTAQQFVDDSERCLAIPLHHGPNEGNGDAEEAVALAILSPPRLEETGEDAAFLLRSHALQLSYNFYREGMTHGRSLASSDVTLKTSIHVCHVARR